MDYKFIRTEMLLGTQTMQKLESSKVIVFGIGGVGSYVVEALARCGVGNFVLVDNDKISISNCNRQIHATCDTVGKWKAEVMKERILSINPNANVKTHITFFLPQQEDLIETDCDYIVDAIDTVTAKIELVLQAQAKSIPIICSMGTGNKLNPSQLQIADIYETSVCPLAKVMRKELKARGVKNLKVVYSKEQPLTCKITEEQLKNMGEKTKTRSTPGSISFVPSVAGLLIASEIVKDLMEENKNG